mgnify:FL=1
MTHVGSAYGYLHQIDLGLQAGWSTTAAQDPGSQWTAVGFELKSYNTCMPQTGALTNCAYH